MKRSYVTKHCLFCKEAEDVREVYPRTFSDEDLTPAVFSARRVPERLHYRIVRCDRCGLVFSRDVLEESALRDLYAESAFTFAEHTGVLRRDYWRPLEEHLPNVPRGAALDVGCSSGFFLEELEARHFASVAGCEPSIAAKRAAPEAIRRRIRSTLFEGRKTFPRRRFDLVCSFHTLDHVADPGAFVAGCRDVLASEGVAYFVTHDVDALQARVLGERSPIIDIEHVYLFSKVTLRRLLETHGFEVKAIGALRNSYPLGYWLRMLPLASGPKRFFSAVARRTGLARLAFPVAAGNIFVIAVPKKSIEPTRGRGR